MKRIETMNESFRNASPIITSSTAGVGASQLPTTPGAIATTSKLVLTPAQAAAEASSRNPSHGYNIPKFQDKTYDHQQVQENKRNCKSFLKGWLDEFINLFAYIVARILNHPDVRDALSSAILEGMVKLCYDENLHEHLIHVDNTLTEHQVSDAAKKGKDAQKIVKAYLGGIFATTHTDSDGDIDKDGGKGKDKKKDR
mmetsp:Transcript_4965/g.11028  ORF Transcript_4965/g.11028 Transcript_4965/m.11028 type:complete len:198 (+) Transcript_4965:233-826(+)